MTRLNTADTMSYANSKESSPIVEWYAPTVKA
jgi:hypothetical protein